MGLDSRYDCFDCQRNTFAVKDAKLKKNKAISMEAVFRIPRPTFPGFLQSKINEELHLVDESSEESTYMPEKGLEAPVSASLQSQGQMFGLTFWENWYILGDSKVSNEIKENNSNDDSKDNGNSEKLMAFSSYGPNSLAIPSVSAMESDNLANRRIVSPSELKEKLIDTSTSFNSINQFINYH
jgi:hypothetical protein